MTRYVLHPGPVTIKYDGQEHFISADRLAQLYGLRLSTTNVAIVRYDDQPLYPRGFRESPDDVHIWPRRNGDYELPKKK